MGAREWKWKTKSPILLGDQTMQVNLTTQNQNSYGSVMWEKKHIQEKQLQSATVQWGNERQRKSGEESDTARGETGTNFYQFSLCTLCGGQQRKINCVIWQLELPLWLEIPLVEKNIMIPPGNMDSCTHKNWYMHSKYSTGAQTHTHTPEGLNKCIKFVNKVNKSLPNYI